MEFSVVNVIHAGQMIGFLVVKYLLSFNWSSSMKFQLFKSIYFNRFLEFFTYFLNAFRIKQKERNKEIQTVNVDVVHSSTHSIY